MPLLFIPPWINKYYILDLQPKNSMVTLLVEQGFTVFVVSWKNPDASMESTTIEDYMHLGPLEASDVVREITGSPTRQRDGLLHRRHAAGDDTGLARGEEATTASARRPSSCRCRTSRGGRHGRVLGRAGGGPRSSSR